jgi:hypothetical protein
MGVLFHGLKSKESNVSKSEWRLKEKGGMWGMGLIELNSEILVRYEERKEPSASWLQNCIHFRKISLLLRVVLLPSSLAVRILMSMYTLKIMKCFFRIRIYQRGLSNRIQ